MPITLNKPWIRHAYTIVKLYTTPGKDYTIQDRVCQLNVYQVLQVFPNGSDKNDNIVKNNRKNHSRNKTPLEDEHQKNVIEQDYRQATTLKGSSDLK